MSSVGSEVAGNRVTGIPVVELKPLEKERFENEGFFEVLSMLDSTPQGSFVQTSLSLCPVVSWPYFFW